MGTVIRYEAGLILLSLSTGAWLMMIYDTLRVFRLAIPHRPWAIGMEDFFYWIGASLCTFSLLYEQNGGKLRAYVIGSVFAGMILYDRIVSRFLFKVLKKMGNALTIIKRRKKREQSPETLSEKKGG
ncbi:MAG: spore cortex biosynthesis protein YabQ [Lachnospiraceae bacterium]|uniref:Spore cortex biosynthesis protein YabQ n=1 Tax=Candidatus Enterocloster excrementigallinarum TaxID=2838558 RepID=A0A9D2TER5_9FIRM|nr:spore cortex biosynthesis protein YabQ [Lachnospiraceae bacterium]HJC67224.1 spore cortex biosynthesis protein YabQ [Candidatus Enterocloster excrementigallinarum]